MIQIDPKLAEILGMKPELAKMLEQVFNRYEDGEPLAEIAIDLGYSEATLRARMKKYDLELYGQAVENAADKREEIRVARKGRIANLGRREIIRRLEDASLSKEIETKDLCKIEKVYGDAYNLARGKSTARVTVDGLDTLFNEINKNGSTLPQFDETDEEPDMATE